jgi:CheY-like chemotaxis protein
MNILLIEDEAPKRDNIVRTLREIMPDCTIGEARSVKGAISCVRNSTPDLILLDMSLPTFDIGPGEPGGRPQGFGGIEVLRYLDRYKLKVPVVVVTAYEAFSRDGHQIDLDALRAQLEKAHPNIFKDIVFYNSLFSAWSDNLAKVVRGAVNQK